MISIILFAIAVTSIQATKTNDYYRHEQQKRIGLLLVEAAYV
jgi:hypothetical protein